MKIAKPTSKILGRMPKIRTSSPTLRSLLIMWGVRKNQSGASSSGRKSDRTRSLLSMNHWELFDLYDRAKSVYRKRISIAHTDKGGNHDLATNINVSWDNTERLFRKLGLEI